MKYCLLIGPHRTTSRLKETTRHQPQGGTSVTEQNQMQFDTDVKSKEQPDGSGGVAQVGELDNLGFGLGAAPSHMQVSND